VSILQISKIQVRRGQKNVSSIPVLSSGEIAWATDAQELYIGNGTIEEDGAPAVGNTRILTENSNLLDYLHVMTSVEVALPATATFATAFTIPQVINQNVSIEYVVYTGTGLSLVASRNGRMYLSVSGNTVTNFSDQYDAVSVSDPLEFSTQYDSNTLTITYKNSVACVLKYTFSELK
jgi:hypothetical protein